MIDKFNFFFSRNKQRVKHIPVIGRRSGGDEIVDHRASTRRQRFVIFFFFLVKRRSVFESSCSLCFHTRESLTDERVKLLYYFFWWKGNFIKFLKQKPIFPLFILILSSFKWTRKKMNQNKFLFYLFIYFYSGKTFRD